MSNESSRERLSMCHEYPCSLFFGGKYCLALSGGPLTFVQPQEDDECCALDPTFNTRCHNMCDFYISGNGMYENYGICLDHVESIIEQLTLDCDNDVTCRMTDCEMLPVVDGYCWDCAVDNCKENRDL